MKPDPGPPKPTVQDLSVIKMRVRGKEVSIANIPNHGNNLAKLVLLDLQRRYPDDVLWTTDFECYRIGDMTGAAPATVEDHDARPAPDSEERSFKRLRVKMRSGSIKDPVGIANIPATAHGRSLLRALVKGSPDTFFHTTDYGQLRLGDIDVESIDALNGIQD